MSKTSVLPAGVRLVGEVEGRGDLVVAGTIEGPIELDGALVIEEGGQVRGDVRVSALVVRGLLTGNASAKESIRVEPSAIVVGDARAPRVQIIDGARVRGRVQMTGEPMAPTRRRRREPDARPEPVAASSPEPARTESVRTEPARTEPARPSPARALPDRVDADRGDAVRVAPIRVASERTAEPRRTRSAPADRRDRAEPEPRPRRDASPARDAEPPREARSSREQEEGRRGREPDRRDRDARRRERQEPERVDEDRAEPSPRASAEPEANGGRRRRRRRGRKPPPPTIPSVERQKARRKDDGDGPSPAR